MDKKRKGGRRGKMRGTALPGTCPKREVEKREKMRGKGQEGEKAG